MRLNHRILVAVAVSLLAASVASADKLKGYLWEVSPASIVVEGQAVSLGPDTKIGVIFYELRDVNRAGEAFEKYLELAPDAPEAPQIRAFLDVLKNQ
jgi:hypothetical protein